VRLELVVRDGRTRLGACYQQVPLRVLPPFPFDPSQLALLYLLNPTAGLMDGDAQRVEVVARAGVRLLLVGQSATRIHPTLHHFSTQQWRIRVESGAVLVMLPGPAIPFQGCRYYQRIEVDLEPDAAFLWGDVWLAGRYARGAASERFQFETIVQELLVRREQQLIFRDRFCWRGPWDDAAAAWHFGAAPAWASLFVTGKAAELPPAGDGLQRASFPTAWGDSCLRWGGTSEAVTAAVVRTALRLAADRIGPGASCSPFLDGHLAPGHWFSPGCAPGRKEEPL
jgi:urease accessory protein